MKKFLASFYALALALAISPLSAIAQENVNTGFTRGTGGGDPPVIKVKWEMRAGTAGQDNSSAAGSQLLPSGEYQVDTHVTYCAVATDPDGVAEINAVYANVYYPEDAAFHNGENGCHEQVGDEILLSQLSKNDGWQLLCNHIRNGNSNLPVWAQGFNYDEVCAQDGELQKETAYVYCGTRDLSYEDPSGQYWVKVHAADDAGNDSEQLINPLIYVGLTAFDIDFSSVNYGNVRLNVHKIKNGDLNFGTSNQPTVRNTGNTRLSMFVRQDDMGLGSTNGAYNVQWDGRVGSDAAFSFYDPFASEQLENILELSEDDEMDFSILVRKFPIGSGDAGHYQGEMQLSAQAEEHLSCGE